MSISVQSPVVSVKGIVATFGKGQNSPTEKTRFPRYVSTIAECQTVVWPSSDLLNSVAQWCHSRPSEVPKSGGSRREPAVAVSPNFVR